MIKVSVLYPTAGGTRFDHDYYMTKHMPMVRAKLAPALVRAEVDRGLAGATGGAAPFHALAHLHFESVEAFQAALAPHANEIMGDIPNYTNAHPEIQISNVVW